MSLARLSLRHGSIFALLLGAGAIACGDVEDEPRVARDSAAALPPAAAADSVDIVFSRAEQPVAVRRPLGDGDDPLRAALDALLAGPSAAERASGLESWFSDATAGSLRSVEVDSAGRATVDFHDLRALIPNASSSTGSGLLLSQLNATVFGVPEVQSIEYRIDGSCDAFWDWLQYGCQTVTRANPQPR